MAHPIGTVIVFTGHTFHSRVVTDFILDRSQKNLYTGDMFHDTLILSIFPGIDLLGRAFEERGFCVVRGPDLITGGDIRTFHPPSGRFNGVIGGPPCQDFSKLNRNPTGYGQQMLHQFCRVVSEALPDWYLFENVVAAPSFKISGYRDQRFALDLAWFCQFSRRRDFVFGSKCGRLLNPMSDTRGKTLGTCVTGVDPRSFRACCDIHGLPGDFDLPFYTLDGKKQAVANAVPLQLGRYVASLVAQEFYGTTCKLIAGSSPPGDGVIPIPSRAPSLRRCQCDCGRVVVGRARYASASCRKRAQRARQKTRIKS